jgi:hypothetical protein
MVELDGKRILIEDVEGSCLDILQKCSCIHLQSLRESHPKLLVSVIIWRFWDCLILVRTVQHNTVRTVQQNTVRTVQHNTVSQCRRSQYLPKTNKLCRYTKLLGVSFWSLWPLQAPCSCPSIKRTWSCVCVRDKIAALCVCVWGVYPLILVLFSASFSRSHWTVICLFIPQRNIEIGFVTPPRCFTNTARLLSEVSRLGFHMMFSKYGSRLVRDTRRRYNYGDFHPNDRNFTLCFCN